MQVQPTCDGCGGGFDAGELVNRYPKDGRRRFCATCATVFDQERGAVALTDKHAPHTIVPPWKLPSAWLEAAESHETHAESLDHGVDRAEWEMMAGQLRECADELRESLARLDTEPETADRTWVTPWVVQEVATRIERSEFENGERWGDEPVPGEPQPETVAAVHAWLDELDDHGCDWDDLGEMVVQTVFEAYKQRRSGGDATPPPASWNVIEFVTANTKADPDAEVSVRVIEGPNGARVEGYGLSAEDARMMATAPSFARILRELRGTFERRRHEAYACAGIDEPDLADYDSEGMTPDEAENLGAGIALGHAAALIHGVLDLLEVGEVDDALRMAAGELAER